MNHRLSPLPPFLSCLSKINKQNIFKMLKPRPKEAEGLPQVHAANTIVGQYLNSSSLIPEPKLSTNVASIPRHSQKTRNTAHPVKPNDPAWCSLPSMI